jgi:hypothetical protein
LEKSKRWFGERERTGWLGVWRLLGEQGAYSFLSILSRTDLDLGGEDRHLHFGIPYRSSIASNMLLIKYTHLIILSLSFGVNHGENCEKGNDDST